LVAAYLQKFFVNLPAIWGNASTIEPELFPEVGLWLSPGSRRARNFFICKILRPMLLIWFGLSHL